MKIVCLDGYTLNPGDNPWADIEALGELTVHDRTPADLIAERSAGANVILTNKTPLLRETLEQLPDLKFISVLATGYNVVDIEYARERGIVVSNIPEYSTDSVAQFVFAMVLNHCHHIAAHDEAAKERWATSEDFCFWDTPLIELTGKTMGIVGFGRIGQRVGELAHSFGMDIIAHSRSRSQTAHYPFEWRDLEGLFAEADFISLHCPQTSENTGFVNAELIDKMKPTGYLINTARGPLINEQDLANVLNSEKIAGAAVDVASAEPIAKDNPLLTAKNITITPHIAWATLEARKRLMKMTAENISAFQAGSAINVVS